MGPESRPQLPSAGPATSTLARRSHGRLAQRHYTPPEGPKDFLLARGWLVCHPRGGCWKGPGSGHRWAGQCSGSCLRLRPAGCVTLPSTKRPWIHDDPIPPPPRENLGSRLQLWTSRTANLPPPGALLSNSATCHLRGGGGRGGGLRVSPPGAVSVRGPSDFAVSVRGPSEVPPDSHRPMQRPHLSRRVPPIPFLADWCSDPALHLEDRKAPVGHLSDPAPRLAPDGWHTDPNPVVGAQGPAISFGRQLWQPPTTCQEASDPTPGSGWPAR